MPSLASFATKIVACSAVAFGLTLSPSSFNSTRVSKQVEEKSLPEPESKKVRAVILASSDKGNGFSLNNSENINKLLSGNKSRLNVAEAGVRFGNFELNSKDILFSPCQDGTYYLLKFVSNYQYKWENGNFINSYACFKGKPNSPYANLNKLELKWATPKRRNYSLTTINLDQCFFTKSGTDSLKIICDENGGWSNRVEGTFDKDNYKYD